MNMKRSAHILQQATGFSFADCLAELEAEEGDFFAALARIKDYRNQLNNKGE